MDSLQDQFLSELAQNRTPATVYLVNGIRLIGEIESFDQYSLVIRGRVSQLVYKHAISTVVPSRDTPQGAARIETPAGAPEARTTTTLRTRRPVRPR